MKNEITFINDVRSTLWKTINGFTDVQLNDGIEEGKWTIMQVLEHLYLTERSVTKGIQDKLENGGKISATSKPIQFTVDRSTKVVAPSFLEPATDFLTLEAIKEKLDGSRAALLYLIDQSPKENLQDKGFTHPIFGVLSLDQWVEFIGFHEKRHIAQIEEMIQLKNKETNQVEADS